MEWRMWTKLTRIPGKRRSILDLSQQMKSRHSWDWFGTWHKMDSTSKTSPSGQANIVAGSLFEYQTSTSTWIYPTKCKWRWRDRFRTHRFTPYPCGIFFALTPTPYCKWGKEETLKNIYEKLYNFLIMINCPQKRHYNALHRKRLNPKINLDHWTISMAKIKNISK